MYENMLNIHVASPLGSTSSKPSKKYPKQMLMAKTPELQHAGEWLRWASALSSSRHALQGAMPRNLELLTIPWRSENGDFIQPGMHPNWASKGHVLSQFFRDLCIETLCTHLDLGK